MLVNSKLTLALPSIGETHRNTIKYVPNQKSQQNMFYLVIIPGRLSNALPRLAWWFLPVLVWSYQIQIFHSIFKPGQRPRPAMSPQMGPCQMVKGVEGSYVCLECLHFGVLLLLAMASARLTQFRCTTFTTNC